MRRLPCNAMDDRSSRGAMKPATGYTGLAGASFCLHRSVLNLIPAVLIALFLFGSPATINAATSVAPAATAHVYLLRGVLNVFSLGLDEIAARLQAQGIPVTVANFVSWSSLANEAAAEYR